MLQEYLEKNILIADGAIGTYYYNLYNTTDTSVEEANLTNSAAIRKIHKEYIDSGAKLIRTNTFSANTVSLNCDKFYLKSLIDAACKNLREASGKKDLFFAGNIGPIFNINGDGKYFSDSYIIDEYKYIVDLFLENSISIFNFETFSNIDFLEELFDYIKSRKEDSIIMIQFSVSKDGYTRNGIHYNDLFENPALLKSDVIGFNCGSGPAHLLKLIKKLKITKKILSFYPNAGYPELVNNRTFFNTNERYFAEKLIESTESGVKIIGGCCGTEPKHIKALSNIYTNGLKPVDSNYSANEDNNINSKPNSKKYLLAVELDPPTNYDLSKIIQGAKRLKDIGADIITLADSPSGRVRLNPIIAAARINREVGIRVMPHLCCRDRNLIALKSDILGGYSEGIRDFLFVTGDPIPLEEKDVVKKVFNCNSTTLMSLADQFNKNIFSSDPVKIAGAFNINAQNIDAEIIKMNKKVESGAELILTQPIFDDSVVTYIKEIVSRKNVTLLAGIMPIVTYNNAQFLNNEFPGISIPERIINYFRPDMSREEAEEVGIEVSVNMVNKLKQWVDGFYFITPFFRTSMIEKIIYKTSLVKR